MATAKEALRRATHAYGRRNRSTKARFARHWIADHNAQSVLLVGVSAEPTGAVVNRIEEVLVSAAPRVVVSGIGDPMNSTWAEYVHADALALPFDDAEFDLVYSNAVIEHVGGEEEQRQYVAEHARVGRSWIITTPNRAFPIESHTQVIARHWLPTWKDPRSGGGSVTRLLTKRTFADLLPARARIVGNKWSPTLTAVSG